MADDRVPVLIVGGGVVGLSASLFLAQQGVRSMLVERHPGTSIHPRARGVNGRTMELMRELGLEEAVRRASVKLGPSVGIYAGTTLVQVLESRGEGGWFLKRLRARGVRGQATKKSPTGPCRCTQDELEPVLLEAARGRGVDARFFTELVDLAQDADGVTGTIADRRTGERRTVRADYLIAADGARSPIRGRLGVTQSGAGVLAHQLNLYFRADLAALVKGREFSMCLVENEGLRGLFASINNSDLWVLHVSYYPEKGERPEDFPPERCVQLIRKAVGMPELEVELKGALPWQSTVRVADGYQHGRVFLAGDAAHVMPPWGGFGANSGIQDAHNLAWKLAAVLGGQAGPELLATYDVERRPVARAVAEISGSMSDERGLMTIPKGLGSLGMLWNMRRIFPYMTMGYGYASAAVVLERGSVPGPGTSELRGRPGTRAPHVWLEREGKKLSALDLLGRGFVLLAGRNGSAWCEAAQAISKRMGVRMDTFRVGVDLRDPEDKWPSAYGVKAEGAILVRPDGIVAWRSKGKGASPEETLTRVLAQVLARQGTVRASEAQRAEHGQGPTPRAVAPLL
ncbi:FAD-dependent monooxygenase [Hyalangium versicolor]|uniref:FAD-dependent monooxygenase n=1 Tax=Hyalangium versicolor TaxID=2861190 RepID=UPI001CCB4998|nr:FAD-dependent monooxygenase [Hyalangium versicolor]